MYLDRKGLAAYLSVSERTITDWKDLYFVEGVHYFNPHGNMIRYKKEAIDEWMERKEDGKHIQQERRSMDSIIQGWQANLQERKAS